RVGCSVFLVGAGPPPKPYRARSVDELRLAADMTRMQVWIGTLREAVVKRQHVVLGRFGHEPVLQLAPLLRLLGRQIIGLREVLVDVVELPAVLVEARAA